MKAKTGRGSLLSGLALLVSGAVLVASSGATPAGAANPPPKVGIVCTNGQEASATEKVFDLTTKTGYISLPDANTAFMWGFSSGHDGFQHPGPVLCVTEGDTVTVILHNPVGVLDVDTSIAFPGQKNVLADGVPAQPEFNGGGKMTSLTDSVAPGGTITYSFVAENAGTFLYQSGTDGEKQVRMGLFGALIVRPQGAPGQAYDSPDSAFTLSEEFMVMLSEIDPYLNQAVEEGKSFNMNRYHPRYWLVNGRGFPDSIADNGASWLPSQPYGALAQVHEFGGPGHPLPGLARYLNVGTEDYPFHPHGNNGLVIGRDGAELKNGTRDLSFEKFAINIGPGQTWDVLFKWLDAEAYDPDTNTVPDVVPSMANSVIGVFYSGSPYLGKKELLPPGSSSLNQCGEFYIISHNHALFQITSWGANMTGPITYMKILPPTGCGQ